jgi:hypothetical protein
MKTNYTGKLIILGIILCLTFNLCYSQDWGVGVKLGDPLGISVKKYNGDKAFELIIGRAYYWGSYNYGYNFYHDNRYKNKSYYFIGTHSYSRPIAIQLHYLIHKDISQLDGLKWYFGFGGQFRYSHYYYDYWDQNSVYRTDKITDLGIGPDGVIGLEYTFNDVPISLALDAVLYMEIFDRPFLFLGQGGLALRYNF